MTDGEHLEGDRPVDARRNGTFDAVTIRQGGVREVTAKDVRVRQGGVVRAHAERIAITQGGIVLAKATEIDVTAGGVVGALARAVKLDGAMAQVVVACEKAEVDQSLTTVMVARDASVKDSVVGVLLAGRVDGDNIRVVMNTRSALAFGVAAGFVVWLLSRLGGRR
jgi:hypothetical protein